MNAINAPAARSRPVLLLLSLAALLHAFPPPAASAQAEPETAKPSVLVITGGHGFEKAPFFKMFSDNPTITYAAEEHVKGSATAWDRSDLARFNVVVLYDMAATITDAQKANFLALLKQGTGLVVLHHALASYPAWPEYERIIGGRYPLPGKGEPAVSDKVGYQHDVDVPVVITDARHPITAGLKDFMLRDEIYWGYRVGADVSPLETTTHAKSGKPLMWTRTEGSARIVFLQCGHDHYAFEHPSFRELVSRSIKWAARP